MAVEKLCPLPPGAGPGHRSLGEAASIAIQGIRSRGRPVAGETPWSSAGAEDIGVLATLFLTELGVRVVVADVDPNRAESALAFGALEALVVNPAGEFPEPQSTLLRRVSDGDGVSLVIEGYRRWPPRPATPSALVAQARWRPGRPQQDVAVPITEWSLRGAGPARQPQQPQPPRGYSCSPARGGGTLPP